MENRTKFCHCILSKIIKIVAIICEFLRQKYTKFDFDWDSASIDTAGRAYSASADPVTGIQGAYF